MGFNDCEGLFGDGAGGMGADGSGATAILLNPNPMGGSHLRGCGTHRGFAWIGDPMAAPRGPSAK